MRQSRPARASRIGRVVAASARHPWLVLLAATLLALAAAAYAARHFALTADTAELISTDLEWRQRELDYAAAFPQLQNLVVVVIDGATPELVEAAARRLEPALRQSPLLGSVRDPQGDAFFARNGVLLLPLAEVEAAMQGLIRAQPFLGSLAADPTLHGVAGLVATLAQGMRQGGMPQGAALPLLERLAAAFEAVLAGRPAFFSWRALLDQAPPGPRQTRRVLLVQPVLDYAALQPGAAATAAIRDTARDLGIDAAHGLSLRLTGPVPMADEEFATLAEDAWLLTGTMLAALVGILWLAVRSVRIAAAILGTTLLGLVITAGIGLLAAGRFNLISVAFIPLFVGLGIDFSIQFSVRYRAERLGHARDEAALAAAGRGVGRALLLSAAAIGAGFFAFLPTSYIGLAELGLIAGLGMMIAFALSITLLPALLALLRPRRAGRAETGFASLAPVEAFLRRRRRGVLGVALAVAALSLALLPLLRFDFNPLHLRSERVESMATLRELEADPDRTPNTISVLRPTLAEARALGERLALLPEVSRTLTLADFVPARQEEKLALIADAAMFLGPALEAPPAPPATDAALRARLESAALALRQAGTEGEEGEAARRLAAALERLAADVPAVRGRAAVAVAGPLPLLLDQIRAMLQAAPVTAESLPPGLAADWIARDGRYRVEAHPRPGVEDNAALIAFSDAIQRVAPDATGVPISIREAGASIVTAFLQAGLFSALAVVALLALALRRARDVTLTMLPVLLSGLLTFATCAALGLPLNFANIIALPLLFGVGVAFNIYFVMAWRAGETDLLQSSLTRAVVFSALTTAIAFGALWLSSHPGTASMGRLLMISLGWELLVTLFIRPALLARPPAA